MRTRSPNFRNGVDGLPSASVSTVRCSARHDAPWRSSWLAIVPEPTIVPADERPRLRRMRDELGKAELHVDAGFRRAEPRAVDPGAQRQGAASRRATRRRAHPASTNTGDNAERGLDCRNPKPFASSFGIRLRSETSLTRPTAGCARAACAGVDAHRHIVGDDDDFGFEIDAPFLAADQDRIARPVEAGARRLIHQRIGVETLGHFGAARAAHALDVRQIRAAVDELVRARQRRGERAHVERERASLRGLHSTLRTAHSGAARRSTSRRARAAASARCRSP